MNTSIPLTVDRISHKTAPVKIREAVAFDKEEQIALNKRLRSEFRVDGSLILSTCNRTEVYLSAVLPPDKQMKILRWLADFKGSEYFLDDTLFYFYQGKEALRHFFMVTAGLDSQILGEPQITGQVKEAYGLAHDLKATDALINKMFNYALQAQKEVRHKTFLSEGAVSVSFAGVELARKIFTSLNDKIALLIGAGETAELAALHFMEKGVGHIFIANRTYQKAEELAARFSGDAITLERIPEILPQVDIVISATSSPSFVLTKEMVEPIYKKRSIRPVFIIDLAIPRDIDPELDQLDYVYLYNLDDLNEVVESNLAKRREEVPQAQKIIQQYMHQFIEWYETHASAKVIQSLKDYFENLRQKELERLNSRLPEEGREQVEYLATSILNKVVHQHIRLLKEYVHRPDKYEQYLEFLKKMYRLD